MPGTLSTREVDARIISTSSHYFLAMSLQDEGDRSAKSFFAVALVVDEGRGNFSFNPNQPCVVYHR